MIEVSQITKRFLDREVLREITFRVDQGEIVGFLGPNGAGKTTTLRIITGYLPATSGRVTVAGHDVFDDSIAVRRAVGYLPESVPLYPEMRVHEYLRFRAALKGVPRAEHRREIQRVMELVQLVDMSRRVVGQLSKGYRQRVGLADALLGRPKILILDEPTVGLDPNQIRQVRGLIRELGKDHTILLSTHILPEVEAVATRVVIVHQGRVVGAGRPDELKQRAQTRQLVIRVEARGVASSIKSSLGSIDGATAAELSEGGADATAQPTEPGIFELGVYFTGVESGAAREAVFQAAIKDGWVLRGLEAHDMSLEDVFAKLTTAEPEAESQAAPGGDGKSNTEAAA